MLSIADLHFTYPKSDRETLSGVSITVPEGGVFGLLGPNGAGKTTLQRILVRQLTPDSGTINLDGKPLSDCLPHELTLVPQSLAFYERLSVEENLHFFSSVINRGAEIKSRCASVLKTCQLEPHRHKPAWQLSGGLKRRLNLAIGLLSRPVYLFLDEPTVGVDPHSRLFLLESIAELSQQGTTIVYASHYMEEVESLCDQIVILDKGNVLSQGLVSDLCKTVSDVLELTLLRPLSPSEGDSIRHRYQLIEKGVKIRIEQYAHQPCDILEVIPLLLSLQVPIATLNYRQQSLEALFLELTDTGLRD